jgi:hypothetical protein
MTESKRRVVGLILAAMMADYYGETLFPIREIPDIVVRYAT